MQATQRGTSHAISIRQQLRGITMTFMIEKICGGQITTLRLIGRLQWECLEEMKKQVEGGSAHVILDLAEVTLIDVEVVRFLNNCQSEGIEIINSSPYIREWMRRERELS
jgi:hypothetical protein